MGFAMLIVSWMSLSFDREAEEVAVPRTGYWLMDSGL
jgi:hypothetical protein